MGSILFRNRIRCREKSLSKRCIIRVENRYLPGNCDPTHRDDRMTGIRHSSEPGRRLLVNIFLLFFPLFPLVSLSLSLLFSLLFSFFFFFPICSLLRYTGATRFTRVRSNDKQNETLCMPKTAISDTNVPVSRGEGRGYSDTKKIKRGGTIIEEALGNGVNG